MASTAQYVAIPKTPVVQVGTANTARDGTGGGGGGGAADPLALFLHRMVI